MYSATDNAAKRLGVGSIPLPGSVVLVLTVVGIADAAYVAHGNYAGVTS
jgi:hypothetical protein